MYNLTRGIEKALRETGVQIHTDSEVVALSKRENEISGIELKKGEHVDADIVVSNMEVIPAYRELLREPDTFLQTLEKFEPACSGLVLHLGTSKKFPALSHHNFFFSGNQKSHFNSVFNEHKIPDDPTLYVVAPARTDSAVAPEGCDNIKILPHIPYIQDTPSPHEEYVALRARILDKMERMGLNGLKESIVVEDMWTPHDIHQRYYSNRGSIYGVVSDLKKNFALKAPKQSTRYPNLYFTGGSVNPGGGMPMVTLSGMNTAELIARNNR
jgi:diapolycopene oxygenase